MKKTEQWDGDPAVRTMRRIFGHMEKAQQALFTSLEIDAHDPRLRGWREAALPRFERCWRVAARQGTKMTEQRAALVYLHCLAAEMNRDGVRTDSVLKIDDEIEALLKGAEK
jgi:hypothetical protein